jgi:hypothetical protein
MRAVLCRLAAFGALALPNWFSRDSDGRDPDGRESRLLRETAIATVTLVFGLLGMPFLIWGAGRLTLGDYAHGGPTTLLADCFTGLAHGAAAFWVVVVGPYALLMLGRLILFSARR